MTEQEKNGLMAKKIENIKNTKHFGTSSEEESESSESDSTDTEKSPKPMIKKTTRIVQTKLPPTTGGKRNPLEEKQEAIKKTEVLKKQKPLPDKETKNERKTNTENSNGSNNKEEKKKENIETLKHDKKTEEKKKKEDEKKEDKKRKNPDENEKKSKPRKKKSNIKIWKQEEPTTKIYKLIKMVYEYERPPPTNDPLFVPTILENDTVSRDEYNQMKNILRSRIKNCEAWIQHYQYFIYNMLEDLAFENQESKFDDFKKDYKEKHSYPFPKGKKYMN